MNRTGYAVLGLLAIEPQTGYDLKQLADTSLAHFWRLGFGSIYPALHALEAEGLASHRTEARPDAPDAKVYRVTERGVEALERWLREPPSDDEVRSELLLKVFLGANTENDVLVNHLRAERDRVSRRVEALEGLSETLGREGGEHASFPFWSLALRRGVLALHARLRWCDEALESLER